MAVITLTIPFQHSFINLLYWSVDVDIHSHVSARANHLHVITKHDISSVSCVALLETSLHISATFILLKIS
jgi:hypothetical protein